jgi:L-fuconolactonase
LTANQVAATVLIQAASSEDETRYLLKLTEAHSFIAGVVGWVDFEAPEVRLRIARLALKGRGKLKGLRPMIQDIADPLWISRPSLDAAFEAMIAQELVFDALVRPKHLEALRRRLMQHPGLRAVLDHAGKPDIAHWEFSGWARSVERLARDTSIFCKLSGLLTEAGDRVMPEDLVPYVAHIFSCFGPGRILWGSDWPVLMVASGYTRWLALSRQFVERLAAGREHDVFAATAVSLYHLELS